MKARWMLVVALLGCSAEAPSAAGPAHEAPAEAGSKTFAAADTQGATERLIVREAQLRLRATDPRRVADAVGRLTAATGGFVLDSDVRTTEGVVEGAELDLRVPQASLDGLLGRLRALGTVLAESVTGRDVTEEFVDVSARLQAERVLEARLLALAEHSAALKDLLVVEQELTRVRSAIEQKEGRVRYLTERARLASIVVVVEAAAPAPVWSSARLGPRFVEAFRRSSAGAIAVTEALVSAAGFVVPIVPLLLPAFWLRRRRIARRLAAGVG
jgi:Domain of unknown function (DUF4349)